MANTRFSFEDLDVWKKSLDFSAAVIDLTEEINLERKHYRLMDQLEAASASISLNIAEGKGRYSKKEFIQFLYVARGSLFEAVTLLCLFHKKKWIKEDRLDQLKCFGDEIGKMLSGLTWNSPPLGAGMQDIPHTINQKE